MNLGLARASRAPRDAEASVAENRARLRAFLPGAPVWLDQVHGANAIDVGENYPHPPRADAAIARDTGVVCAVLTADCLPVLLCDRSGSIVAIAHAGWRGLAGGVIENVVAAMEVEPGTLLAWLGPAIGPDAFEVGVDVHSAFCATDPGASTCFSPKSPGKWRANLFALARRRLAAAGVRAVYGDEVCTYTNSARFFSFRRDGETGRMATSIWLDSR